MLVYVEKDGKKIIIRSVLTLAHSVAGIDIVLHAPIWIAISLTILISLSTSLAKLEPFTWDKTALQIFQSPQTYTQTMRTAHLFGDPLTAEHIYLDAIKQTQQPHAASQLRSMAYPQEKLEQLRVFWTALLAKQPSSREAYAALTAIHQSLNELEAISSTIETWMFIEPNDPRIAGVKSLTK